MSANSQPMAPAPMMAMLLGCLGSVIASRLPMICLPSKGAKGNCVARAPTAMMMCSAVTSLIPAEPVMHTLFGPVIGPCPSRASRRTWQRAGPMPRPEALP